MCYVVAYLKADHRHRLGMIFELPNYIKPYNMCFIEVQWNK